MQPKRYYASFDVGRRQKTIRVPHCQIMRIEAHCAPGAVIGVTQDKGKRLIRLDATAIILRSGDVFNFIPEMSVTHFYARAFGGTDVKKPSGTLIVSGVRREEKRQ